MRTIIIEVALASALAVVPAAGQQGGGNSVLGRAFTLERRGRYADAAQIYEAVLRGTPGNLTALFGLERVLRPLGRLREMRPLLDTALVIQHGSSVVRGLQLRVLSGIGDDSAMARAAESWIAADPASADPYREWAFGAAAHGDLDMARRILERGNVALGGVTLIQELAQVDAATGDWSAAARDWHRAAAASIGVLEAAGMALGQAPSGARDTVLTVLRSEFGDSTATLLSAELLVGWQQPMEGWKLLSRALPDDREQAVQLLRQFADRAGATGSATGDAARARGLAFERLASLQDGAAAQETRVNAARAYAAAGDAAATERMLNEIADDPAAAPASAGPAMAGLIALTARAGHVEEAEARFRQWRDRLSVDNVEMLRLAIARAWIRRGALKHADTMLVDDSTVEADAVRGWIALYRGDLKTAINRLQAVGPYAGGRREATARTSMLALVQRIQADSQPALGAALLRLAEGDTAGAVAAIVQIADGLPAAGGRADLLLFAGRLSVRRDDAQAEQWLTAAFAADTTGATAPAAELDLAELFARTGRTDSAANRLEHLILAHPESAVVPQARRLLDQIRGAIPQS